MIDERWALEILQWAIILVGAYFIYTLVDSVLEIL
jgi:hypothetical protein